MNSQHTSAVILAIRSGVTLPHSTVLLKLGFFISFRFEIRLRTRFLYFMSVFLNSWKIREIKSRNSTLAMYFFMLLYKKWSLVLKYLELKITGYVFMLFNKKEIIHVITTIKIRRIPNNENIYIYYIGTAVMCLIIYFTSKKA